MSARLVAEEMIPMIDNTKRTGPVVDDAELRQRAIKRLQDKRGLMAHSLAYLMVNLLLVALWLATGAAFFWPVFPIFGWGIGLAFHAWDVLWPEPGSSQIAAEMDRLRRKGER